MQAGEILDGRYRIVRKLGAGGFGSVWEAFDERIRRSVAVKVITHGGGEDAETAAARFAQEATLAGGLNNPHIVTIHDYGQAVSGGETVVFLVMELASGRSLASVLGDGVPTVENAVEWTRQMCDALADAHAAGVVHRDIKPENIVVDEQRNQLKVLDFGIATAQGSSNLTQTGMVIGTFLYMAPERCLGRPAGPAADLYSVGCLLHQMLSGAHPIAEPGVEAVTLLYKHVHEPVAAPSTRRPDVPPWLDDVVMALLAKEPEQRPADAGAVMALLAAGTASGGVPTQAAPVAPPTAPTVPIPAVPPTSALASATAAGPRTGSMKQRLTARAGEIETIGRRGDASRARDLCRELVEEAEQTLGYRHRTTLELRHQLARWTGEAGDAESARRLLVPLLDDCEKVFGTDHYDTVSARTALQEWTDKASR